jgi:small conductance mechanosensitive channel
MTALALDLQQLLQRLGLDVLLLAKVLVILIVAVVLERLVYFALRQLLLRNLAQRDHEDVTRIRFVRNAARFAIGAAALVAVIHSIPSIKSLAVTLFAGAGILVAIVGFAAQKAFADIISGVFIVTFKPFRVGDSIQVGDKHSGTVEDITLRHTVISTIENRHIIIPNAAIGDATIINSTIRDEATCEFVEIPVSYAADLDHAMRVMGEVCKAHPSRKPSPPGSEQGARHDQVIVRLVRIGDSALTLRAYVWAADPVSATLMRFDLYKNILERFRTEHIEVPYPHRTIIHKNATADAALGA